MVEPPPTSSGGSLLHHRPPSPEQGNTAACGRRHHHHGARFGPNAPAMELRPRSAGGGSSGSNNHRGAEEAGPGSPHAPREEEVTKPQTGMTIRLTPELLGRLKEPGPRPRIELVLKRAEEGGPVLIVGGVSHNMNAHQMAVGSEVDLLAKTTNHSGGGGGRGGDGSSGTAAGASASASAAQAGMSVFASLHRKLIVQQVLTETKRAVIRARNEEIERREREAKKKIVRMEDQDEMLAAAESIPAPVEQTPQQHQEPQEHGGGERGPAAAGARAGTEEGGSRGKRRRRPRRDPLTAWVCGCYNSDGYTGHVSDLRQFFRGIDFQHVMFRYHVKTDGTLEPDRRRFCVKFKTKAGRDLAVKRSGEALGSFCSWWDPQNVAVVVRGRDEPSQCGRGVSGVGGVSGVNDLLVVLPHGRSVADVLEKIRTRLPSDLSPALAARRAELDATAAADGEEEEASKNRKRKRKGQHRDSNDGGNNNSSSNSSSSRAASAGCYHRSNLEAFRRDTLRAALGASLAEALALGPRWGAPAAAARVAGTDENNALRVATLASREASRELDVRLEAAEAEGGEEEGVGGRKGRSSRRRRFSEGLGCGARERARKRRRGSGEREREGQGQQ